MERKSLNTRTREGVPADTPTLKSVEVKNEGLEIRDILPWGLRGFPFI